MGYKIGLMVSASFRIPRPETIIYSPIDITTQLAQELTLRGHEVTLYTPRDSQLAGVTIASYDLPALRQESLPSFDEPSLSSGDQAKISGLWDQFLIAQMYRNAAKKKHDLLHIQPVDRALPLALSHPEIPTLYTLHDPILPWRAELFHRYASDNQYYVSISNAQRSDCPDLNYAGTAYNGIELKNFAFDPQGGDYLIFVGRINPVKGVQEAMDLAHRSQKKLKIIGSIDDQQYFEQQVKPRLNSSITYEGMIPSSQLGRYYQEARALLFPLQWEEPFGLVMIEAMAHGTPVLAYSRGSVPEIVKDGETGQVVRANDQEEMVKAINRLFDFSNDRYQDMRKACRKRVETKFTIKTMTTAYEHIYDRILVNEGSPTAKLAQD